MKKIAIASLIALVATAASALEVGVTSSRDFAATDRNAAGVTLSQQAGAVKVTLGAERTTVGANDQNRYSLVAGYNVVKVGPATVAAKAGGVYVANQTGNDGYAAVVGAGVSVPVSKQVAVGVDVVRQMGQDRIASSDGNRVTAGVSFRF